jgi:tripartite-type tricarboxylate transporter receptor subunit TctC
MSLNPAAYAADATFPSRPIRLIVPFSAGSSTDVTSRLVAEKMAGQMKQPVVVENKPGAAGVIGTQQIARSAPDGYTIGLVSLASLAMVPPTLKEQPYDSVRDFAPLSAMTSIDLYFVTGPRARGDTLSEFVTWASNQTEPVFLGTLGPATSGHLAGLMFGQAAKIKFESIHFRTYSDLLAAMLGEVHAMVVAPSGALVPYVRGGKLKALAMNGPSRSSIYPDVPTFKEVGYPDMQFFNWIGLAAPAKTPSAILDRLSAEIIRATTSPEVHAKLEEQGLRVIANQRDEFAAMIRKDVPVWRDIVRNTGFKV